MVLIRTWWRVEDWEAAHRPKAASFGQAWRVGRAQSAAVAVMPANAVVAVATRSRVATARVSSIVRGGPCDTSSRAMTAGDLLVFAPAAPVDWHHRPAPRDQSVLPAAANTWREIVVASGGADR